MTSSHRVLIGDALATLRGLPAASVSMVCTSPPYYQLRRYLDAGDPNAVHELGSEATVDEFVARLVEVFREVRRVLHPTGICCINIGDGYSAGTRAGRKPPKNVDVGGWLASGTQGDARCNDPSIPAKNLLLVPFALAFALRADGWYVRSVLPWVKWQSCMPESVRDRPTSAVEYVLMCSKQGRYFWDGVAAQRVSVSDRPSGNGYKRPEQISRGGPGQDAPWQPQPTRQYRNADGFLDSLDAAIASARADLARLEAARATGGLLTDADGEALALLVNPQPFTARSLGIQDDDHYAKFPEKLVEPLVKAGCPERVCGECGAPWERVVRRGNPSKWAADQDGGRGFPKASDGHNVQSSKSLHREKGGVYSTAQSFGFAPTCECFGHFELQTTPPDEKGDFETVVVYVPRIPLGEHPTRPGVVLDCFAGTGTTSAVAKRLGRSSIAIELNPSYATMIEKQIERTPVPLFGEVVVGETVEAPAPNGHRQASLLEPAP